jgi:hypothetical protein
MPTPTLGVPKKYTSFLFMKVGDHAGETFDKIIERKRREKDRAGMIFWGYGGAACHPLTQVRPFLKVVQEDGAVPYLLMQKIRSNADQEMFPAQEYSEDGVTWKKIPAGITVTGSRYALVLDEIQPGDFLLDTREFEIGIGPSRGKRADDYLQGRTDKACLVRTTGQLVGLPDAKQVKQIDLIAKLRDPYAVLLR